MKCINCGCEEIRYHDWQDERDQINGYCVGCGKRQVKEKPTQLPIDFVDADELPEFDRECKVIIYFKYNSGKFDPTDIIIHWEQLEKAGIVCVMDMELK